MAKTLPPLTWFRAFEAAARRLSFTAAAEEIGMTQSAVSQHVKALESRLGVPLFIRHARRLSLTDDGRKLLPHVGDALGILAVATQTFEAGPTQNLLTVATSVSVAQWMIAPRLAEFSERFPDTRLRFLSTIWPDDFHSLRADIEIPFGSHKQFGQDAIFLEPSDLVAVKSPSLEGALHSLPLIESVGTSNGWHTWPWGDGNERTPHVYVDTFGAALTMAMHGNGVALVCEVLAQSALESGQLIRAHDQAAPCKEGYFLRVNTTGLTSVQFRNWFLEQVQSAP